MASTGRRNPVLAQKSESSESSSMMRLGRGASNEAVPSTLWVLIAETLGFFAWGFAVWSASSRPRFFAVVAADESFLGAGGSTLPFLVLVAKQSNV